MLHTNVEITDVNQLNETTLVIRGLASTPTIDSHESTFAPMAFHLERYKKNPVILYEHYTDRPVGKATAFSQTPHGLEIEATIYKDIDPQVFAMVHAGVLKTFSVGGNYLTEPEYSSILDAYVITDFELAEVSLVAVPSNEDALVTGVSLCSLGACSLVRNYNGNKKQGKLDSEIIRAVIRKHVDIPK